MLRRRSCKCFHENLRSTARFSAAVILLTTEVPQIRINELHRDRLVPLALHAGVDFIWVHGASTVLESTLAHSLNSRGTPTLVVEMGVGMHITHAYGEQLTDGIFCLMHRLGIWDGPVITPRTPAVSTNPDEVSFLNAPVSGIFIKEKPHGVSVQKGEVLGRIVDPQRGEILGTITTPADGAAAFVQDEPMCYQHTAVIKLIGEEQP